MKNVAVSASGTDAPFPDSQWRSGTVTEALPGRSRSQTTDNARHVAILGVPIANLTMDDTVNTIDRFVKKGTFQHVATANVPDATPENTLSTVVVSGAYSWIVTGGIVVSVPVGELPTFIK